MRPEFNLKTILLGTGILAVSFFVSLKAMDWLSPSAINKPVLTALPPLPPVNRASSIIAPITIPLAVIRDAAERAAPRNFAGKADNPVAHILQNADIGWTASRGAISATGADNTLSLTTPLSGTLKVKGSLSAEAEGAIGNALGNLLGGNVAKQIGRVNIKNLNANAEIKGNVVMTARPVLTANWRIDPGMTAQVHLGDTNLSVAGARVNVPSQVKPVIDRAVNEQIASLQQRIRNDPILEHSARVQWAQMCRSIPLQGAAGLQDLYLELKPVRAVAVQPRIDASNVTLTLGIEAETRITGTATKPDCPFPATLAIVPAMPGRLSIGVPIDVPFTDINRIIEARLAGKTFPEDGSGPVGVTVRRASVAAAGDRLLISLLIDAKEKKSWFGFGGEATVHIWGKPVLDQTQQTLRLTDIRLAVESEAAFGLLGAAAHAAMPYLQQALADKATVDLKPFASSAREKIAAVMADFQRSQGGVRVGAEITSLKLADIAFDSKTLRVIAEATGAMNVEVRTLPAP
ncbi:MULTISPECIES: DUF4403 family protein [unclassified Nitrobacter]|uniref:DUF4403 family protein n=1 Tax=unclassified Nitrobacter TaxID=2620411 RepID=UPI00092626A2|nr:MULTISPECIES: DUF4403 family protein [unclassified Nitrobacter]MBN9146662.1 DUF4403 family protein [Nitrobacter sp.]OJV02550.1 MAG: hypothetical protein BGO16_09355 [Nitrobacter sp. 62-23]